MVRPSTSKDGTEVEENKVTQEDILATFCEAVLLSEM